MVPVPDNAREVGEHTIAYASMYRGKVYINVRKTYRDRDTGEQAVGKGLTVSVGDFKELVNELPAVAEGLYEDANQLLDELRSEGDQLDNPY